MLFCNAYTIFPFYPMVNFGLIVDSVLSALSCPQNSFSKIEEYLLQFLAVYTNNESEEILMYQKDIFETSLEQLSDFIGYYEKGISKLAISIISNLTAVPGDYYVFPFENTNLFFYLEKIIKEENLTVENDEILSIIFNIFSGNSNLKVKILKSQIIMQTLKDHLCGRSVYEFNCLACLKNLFKGNYEEQVKVYFYQNKDYFEILFSKYYSQHENSYLKNLRFLMTSLKALEELIKRDFHKYESMINFQELRNKKSFYTDYCRIKIIAANEGPENLTEIIEWVENNSF